MPEAEHFRIKNIAAQPKASRPPPVCGIISVGITVSIIGVFVYGIGYAGWTNDSTGLMMLLRMMFFGPLMVFGGIGFGIAGLKRNERWRGLAVLGILLGCHPILLLAASWGITFVDYLRHG